MTINIIIQNALNKNYNVFVKTDKPGKCGYVIGFDADKGYLIRGTRKFYIVLDSTYKATMDGGRLYIQPRNEWTSSREVLEF